MTEADKANSRGASPQGSLRWVRGQGGAARA